MPRMRGRLYSSCASSTWSFPSALTACWAKMSRISCGAVDDAGRERILECPLLGRVEFVVDDQHVRLAVGVELLQLLELALADVGLLVGPRALLDQLLHRLDERRPRQLAQLAQLVLGVGPFREHGQQEPLLGLEPCRGVGSAGDAESMPVRSPRGTSGAASGRADARAGRHPLREPARGRGARTPALARSGGVRARVCGRGRVRLRAAAAAGRAARSARRPLRHRPRAGQRAGPDRRRRRTRLRRDRHEGRRRGCARARPRSRPRPSPAPYDVALLLFGKEELPAQFSPLPDLFERSQLAPAADLAILLEPTDLTIQAGCLGNMNARVTFSGVSGHSARPWTAENAIEKAIEGLAPIAALERREAIVGGLPFYEVVSITQLEAGIASNVIPDRAVATLNFRYPPDRTPGRGGRVPPLAHTRRRRARDHRRLAARRGRHRHAARARAARRRRSPLRAEAGMDERRRLHDARHRRDQLRPGRHPLRAPPRRARRDRRARRRLRDAAPVPRRLSRDADLPHPHRAGHLPVRAARTRLRPRAGQRDSR